MKAEILNNNMKAFESALGQIIVPGMFMIARLKRQQRAIDTTDDDMQQAMIETTEHLMTCGFNTTYAYTTGEEITLLFDINENSYGRRSNKINSVLAGEASANLTQLLKSRSTFDCRIVAFPNKQLVIDYFNWRVQKTQSRYDTCSYWELSNNGRELVTVKFKNAADIVA